jgi:hypothetical protein
VHAATTAVITSWQARCIESTHIQNLRLWLRFHACMLASSMEQALHGCQAGRHCQQGADERQLRQKHVHYPT